MIPALRCALFVASLLVATLSLAACNSGDGDDSDGSSDGNGSTPTPTPFIAPEALSTEDAIAVLDEIDALVREPSRALIAVAQVSVEDVQARSLRILSGENDASGLDDVRIALENEDRVGAGEYLFNVVRHYAQEPLSEPDTNEFNEETLDEIDVNASFDQDHENGMIVSGVYKPAILKMMELWYGLLGVPGEDAASPS
jgi:predicted small secreted protein